MTDLPLEPPTRLDRDPEILWGCTQPELFLLIGLALLMTVPVGLLFAILAHIGQVSFGHLAIPLVGLSSYGVVRFGADRLRQLKRGRPDHYYRLRLHFWQVRLHLARSRFIDYSGPWQLGRDR